MEAKITSAMGRRRGPCRAISDRRARVRARRRSGCHRSGLTLVELVIGVAILAMIMGGLHQVIAVVFAGQERSSSKQTAVRDARAAVERLAMFVGETDSIRLPDSTNPVTVLILSERLLDTYNNTNLRYVVEGDGLLDADTDADGLVNEDAASPDGRDWLGFLLVGGSGTGYELREVALEDPAIIEGSDLGGQTICEGVRQFECRRLATNLVEITLTVGAGPEGVSLTTRARSRVIR